MRREGGNKLDNESRTWWQELESLTKEEGWCCKTFKEAGFEWLQCETWDFRFHRLKLNYCPHCGKKL